MSGDITVLYSIAVHPTDTTTPLLARYLLIKIWLLGNGAQEVFTCTCTRSVCACLQILKVLAYNFKPGHSLNLRGESAFPFKLWPGLRLVLT